MIAATTGIMSQIKGTEFWVHQILNYITVIAYFVLLLPFLKYGEKYEIIWKLFIRFVAAIFNLTCRLVTSSTKQLYCVVY